MLLSKLTQTVFFNSTDSECLFEFLNGQTTTTTADSKMSSTPQLPKPKFVVRDARPEDCASIYQMIYELAVYEKMAERVAISAETLREDAFGDGHPPRLHALIVQLVVEGSEGRRDTEVKAVGYSIYNEVYASFAGAYLWIEDIFVAEAYRRFGLAKALVRKLAAYAKDRQMEKIEWNVLGWNQLAIGFYKSIGAQDMSEEKKEKKGLSLFRLTEEKYRQFLSREEESLNASMITIE